MMHCNGVHIQISRECYNILVSLSKINKTSRHIVHSVTVTKLIVNSEVLIIINNNNICLKSNIQTSSVDCAPRELTHAGWVIECLKYIQMVPKYDVLLNDKMK